MTQLSSMKCRQQPLVQNIDLFFSIDISITDHIPLSKWYPKPLLKSHQTWLLAADATKKTLDMEAYRSRFDRCQKTVQTGTHQRRQRYPKTPQACLSSLTLLLFTLSVERAKKRLPSSSSTAITKGTEIADNSFWVLLSHFGHISCSCEGFCSTDLLTACKVLWVGCGAVLSLLSLLNCTDTWFTVESGISRFSSICRWLKPSLWIPNNPPSGKIGKFSRYWIARHVEMFSALLCASSYNILNPIH